MKLTSLHPLTLFVLGLAGIAGCDRRQENVSDEEDPMAALATPAVSQRYNEAYWGQQRREGTEIWSSATQYCDGKDGNVYPNCRPVLSLMLLERTLDRPRATSPGLDGSVDMTELQRSAQDRLDSLRTPR